MMELAVIVYILCKIKRQNLVRSFASVCTCVYLYVHVCICMCMYVPVCACVYLYVHVCAYHMCAYMCTHVNTEDIQCLQFA